MHSRSLGYLTAVVVAVDEHFGVDPGGIPPFVPSHGYQERFRPPTFGGPTWALAFVDIDPFDNQGPSTPLSPSLSLRGRSARGSSDRGALLLASPFVVTSIR